MMTQEKINIFIHGKALREILKNGILVIPNLSVRSSVNFSFFGWIRNPISNNSNSNGSNGQNIILTKGNMVLTLVYMKLETGTGIETCQFNNFNHANYSVSYETILKDFKSVSTIHAQTPTPISTPTPASESIIQKYNPTRILEKDIKKFE